MLYVLKLLVLFFLTSLQMNYEVSDNNGVARFLYNSSNANKME